MKVVGIEKLSMVDYPGALAAVLFTPGCNLNCFFCHNRRLIAAADALHTWLGEEVALAWLDERKEFLDAVVISGGEPTLQPGLPDFIRLVREKGYLVKLDTNGTNPDRLAQLLREGILDYVAMDVKAPPHRYEEMCGVQVDLTSIDASIQLLLNSTIPYEFRSTVVPQLDEHDVVAIAHWVRGARRYVLQQFRRPQEAGHFPDLRNAGTPRSADWLQSVLPRIRSLVKTCETRGFDATDRAALAPWPAYAQATG